MIKILKDGVVKKDTLIHFIYNATCDKCGCEFEFEIEDIKSQERHPGGKKTIECPYCHKDITKSSFDYREVEVEIE